MHVTDIQDNIEDSTLDYYYWRCPEIELNQTLDFQNASVVSS
jgi:hypothetical protein